MDTPTTQLPHGEPGSGRRRGAGDDAGELEARGDGPADEFSRRRVQAPADADVGVVDARVADLH